MALKTVTVEVDPEVFDAARQVLLERSDGSYDESSLTDAQVVLSLFYMAWDEGLLEPTQGENQ